MAESLKRTLHRRAVRATVKKLRLHALNVVINRSVLEDSESDDLIVEEETNCNVDRDAAVASDSLALDIVTDGDFGDEGFNDIGVDSEEDCEVQSVDEDSSVDFDQEGHASEEDVASDDGDGPPVFQSDTDKEQFVIDSVREWVQEPGVLSMTKVDHLLHRLSFVFPSMPLSYKTLLSCDYTFNISQLASGGALWYKGIRVNLDKLSLRDYLNKYGKIILDIGIDGLPLNKRQVPKKLWPILGHLVGVVNAPFIIAAYLGPHDPNVNEYLSQYIAELQDLFQNGYHFEGKVYQVIIRFYILDAVGRQLIKCIIPHSGYAACEKCEVEGEHISGRLTFVNLDCPARSDESFLQRQQPGHHKADSPLEACGTGMVSQFPLDPMHLVYAGVGKRLLDFWLNEIGAWKIHHEVAQLISNVFLFLRPYCPSDFNRKPISLKYLKSLKCTELRRILLYDGILAFKDLIDDNIYKHFLLLHCSIYIMCNKRLFAAKREQVVEMLRTFISHAALIYGRKFVVYNVHSLIHLVNECDGGLTLDEFSAFKFENKLKSIKESLKSGLHPLQQIARRDKEKSTSVVTLASKPSHVTLSLKHKVLNEVIDGQQYRKLQIGSLKFRLGKADACFQTKNGRVVVLKNIVCKQQKVYLVGQVFSHVEDFYKYPLPSSEIGIVRVSALGREKFVYRLSDFAVIKFLPTEDDLEEYIEVGLSNWLVGELDDHMKGKTYWPPQNRPVTNLIKTQQDFDQSWRMCPVQVLRFYDTFVKAREAVPKFVEDSTYETEAEASAFLGRGQRSRIGRPLPDSSEEDVPVVKKSKLAIPPPPVISQKGNARSKVRKGQGNVQEIKKKEREEFLERLKAARQTAAAKLLPPQSPAGVLKSPSKTKWIVTPLKDKVVSSPSKITVLPSSPIASTSTAISSDKVPFSPCTSEYLRSMDSPESLNTEVDFVVTPEVSPLKSPEHNLTRTVSFYIPSESACRKSPIKPSMGKNANESSVAGKGSGGRQSHSTAKSDGRRNLFPKVNDEDALKTLQLNYSSLIVSVHQMSAKLDMILMNLGRLLRHVMPSERRLKVPHNMSALPLNTRAELNQFETFLGESDVNLAAACDYMASYVKTTVSDPERKSAKIILAKLITNTLGKEMNLEGGNNKIAFRTLNLYKVFQGTLQSAFPDSDLEEAEDSLRGWLKDAKWRKQSVSSGAGG